MARHRLLFGEESTASGNVAVIEKGWIGGGNSGCNTQVTRSNYFYPVSSGLLRSFVAALRGPRAQELNFNVMLSQRGQIALAFSEHELEITRRWANAIRHGRRRFGNPHPAADPRARVPILNPSRAIRSSGASFSGGPASRGTTRVVLGLRARGERARCRYPAGLRGAGFSISKAAACAACRPPAAAIASGSHRHVGCRSRHATGSNGRHSRCRSRRWRCRRW